MKNILVVCLITLMAGLSVSVGQVKQKGISVKLPSASNAVAVPNADKPDALVVAITQDGNIYFGVEQVAATRLGEKTNESLANRSDKTVYVKVDARAPYSVVVGVLDALAGARVSGITLLAENQEVVQSGRIIAPQGLQLKFKGRQ